MSGSSRPAGRRVDELVSAMLEYARDSPELLRLLSGGEPLDTRVRLAVTDTLCDWSSFPNDSPPYSILKYGIVARLLRGVSPMAELYEMHYQTKSSGYASLRRVS